MLTTLRCRRRYFDCTFAFGQTNHRMAYNHFLDRYTLYTHDVAAVDVRNYKS